MDIKNPQTPKKQSNPNPNTKTKLPTNPAPQPYHINYHPLNPILPPSHTYNKRYATLEHIEQNPNTQEQAKPGMYWSLVFVSSVPSDAFISMAAFTRGVPTTHLRALLRIGMAGLESSTRICLCSAFALQMSRLQHARRA